MGAERQDAQLAAHRRRWVASFPPRRLRPRSATVWLKVLRPLSVDSIRWLHQVVWWGHGLLAFGLIVGDPAHQGVPLGFLAAEPAAAEPRRAGAAAGVALESGVQTVRDYTWRQLLQVDACTWCGKCQEVCPGLRHRLPALTARPGPGASDPQLLRTPGQRPTANAASLHGQLVQPDELWACCTCRACEDVCPVLRRAPAADHRPAPAPGRPGPGRRGAAGRPDELAALRQLVRPVAAQAVRLGQALDSAVQGRRKEEVEYLWFVGDYASYDQRAQEVTRRHRPSAARKRAWTWDCWCEKEQNAGNDVRRIGEEGLVRAAAREEPQGAVQAQVPEAGDHRSAHLQHAEERVRIGRRDETVTAAGGHRSSTTRELLDELLRQGALRPSQRAEPDRHLSRSVLPGSVQRRVRSAASRAAGLGVATGRDAAQPPQQFLLRSRRRPDLDEGRTGHRRAAGREPRPGSARRCPACSVWSSPARRTWSCSRTR